MIINKEFFTFDEKNRVIFNKKYFFELLYNEEKYDDKVFSESEDLKKFNEKIEKYFLDWQKIKFTYDKKEKNLLIPEQYQNFDIEKYLYDKIKTKKEKERVEYELYYYKKYEIFDILKIIKYVIDEMKKNNLIIGVGRGSSVSSYVLYLMGVHKVNSLLYDLNFHEFLPKEK